MTNKTPLDIIVSSVGVLLIIIGLIFGMELFTLFWVVVVSIVLVIVSFIIHKLAASNVLLYSFSFVINSISTGLIISAYYIYMEQTVPPAIVTMGAFIIIIILFLMATLYGTISNQRTRKTMFILFILLSLATTITLWIEYSSTLYSLLFFLFLFLDFHVWGFMQEPNNTGAYYKQKSTASFGIYLLITFIVLLIISEGDAAGALSVPVSGEKNKTKEL